MPPGPPISMKKLHLGSTICTWKLARSIAKIPIAVLGVFVASQNLQNPLKNLYFLHMASLGKLRLTLFALFACILNDLFTFSDCVGLIFVKKWCPPSVSSPGRPRFRLLAVADLVLHAFFRQPATVSRSKIEGRRCALPRGPSICISC